MKFLDKVDINGWVVKENIVMWVVWYRSSEGYYNYKRVAIVVTYPDDVSNMYEADSRRIVVYDIHSGAYQDFDRPEKIINAIKYLARKYKLHCKVVKLDWYYHFVSLR